MSGQSRPNVFDEIAKLKNELKAFYRDPKIPHQLKILSKFDLPSLRDVDKTINALVSRRTIHQDAQGNFYIPSVKEMINAEKERIFKRIKERKKRVKRSEEERKKTKATDFEKLKGDLLRQIQQEPIRNCPAFNFVEPALGCHYDIGNSHGYVLVPIPMREVNHEEHKGADDFVDEERIESRHLNQKELLEFIHENTYKITEQLFDNLGGEIDVQIITVTQWLQEESHYDEVKDKIVENFIEVDRIHNTIFFGTSARNNIFPTCDSIVKSLEKQYLMHSEGSYLALIKGYVMKLQYRINRSHEKKERSRKYKGG